MSLKQSKTIDQSLEKTYLSCISTDGNSKYKLLVIDFLTLFNNLKMIENKIKSTVHGINSNEISAVDQETYKNRLIDFIK